MTKMTKKGQEFVGNEISHLMKEGPSKGPQKGKKMPQKQAIAVALNVARRKGFKSPPNPNESADTLDLTLTERVLKSRVQECGAKDESMSIFDSIVKQESAKSMFDDLVEGDVPASMFDDIVEGEAALSMFDDVVESQTQKQESADWENRVARTVTLAEELVGIRTSVKNKK